MKVVRIIRVEQTEEGAIGVLTIDGKAECWTLQPDDKDKYRYCIPSGSYPCQRHHGTKFPDTFEILVPGHTDLLFHPLNLEMGSTGCIGLGEDLGELGGRRAILSSGRAFERFMKKMGDDRCFNLFIINCY